MPSQRHVTEEQRLPGLRLLEHHLDVPLDHAAPSGETITIFAREVVRESRLGDDLPYLLFLQGGPGFASPRPRDDSGWLGFALERFRVVLLDQRGTGRSTPVSTAQLLERGDASAQASYLAHFRADSIVEDAELLRVALQGEAGRWTLLGQSYGGFCSLRYLSAHPASLSGALITGGIPGLGASADEVYRETYALQARKVAEYYRRYPRDVDRARRIADLLIERPAELPDGSTFSARSFQQLGISFGMSYGFEAVHELIEEAFDGGVGGGLSYNFLRHVQNHLTFDTNPIYALLHEMCYTQGTASRWAAERIREEYPEFSPAHSGPLHFTGEMVYPWMFEECAVLRPLRAAAELLAAREDWPHLYDAEVLARNEVPAAAVVYHNDPYVPRRLSLETADSVPNLRTWVTSEYEHNGLRADGPRIVGRLLDLLGTD
jgi:pimeloyl-ACP methyl ester carboxylesterase